MFFFTFYKRQFILIALVLMTLHLPVRANEDNNIRTIVRLFFNLVYKKQYNKAYDKFSESVKQDVNFKDFVRGAKDIKYLKIIKISVTDKESNLVKTKIKTKIHLVYKGSLYEALYEGQVALFLEKNKWKILKVDLEVKSQKLLQDKVKGSTLQKLDFGTK